MDGAVRGGRAAQLPLAAHTPETTGATTPAAAAAGVVVVMVVRGRSAVPSLTS